MPLIKNAIFIVGVQKCGTGTVFNIVNGVPAVADPTKKEPHFLLHDRAHVKRHMDDYLGHLNYGQGEFVIDASTSYFTSETARHNIAEFFFDPTIIVVTRNLSEKLNSSINHILKRGDFDKRDLQALQQRISRAQSWDDVHAIETESVNAGIAEGKIDNSFFLDNIFELNARCVSERDQYWPFRYFSNLDYETDLSKWQSAFSRVHYIRLEQLSTGGGSIASVIEDIGGDPEELDFSVRHNTTFVAPKRLDAPLRLLRGSWLHAGLMKFDRTFDLGLVGRIKAALSRHSAGEWTPPNIR